MQVFGGVDIAARAEVAAFDCRAADQPQAVVTGEALSRRHLLRPEYDGVSRPTAVGRSRPGGCVLEPLDDRSADPLVAERQDDALSSADRLESATQRGGDPLLPFP